jgi:murein L,D-transpeptidase YcbB/YkuD
MRGTRFEIWLATTSIVLVATGSSLPVRAAGPTDAEISAAVPMPESANLPPPTAADLNAAPPATPEESPTGTITPTGSENGQARSIAAPTISPAGTTTPADVAPAAASPSDVAPPAAATPVTATPADVAPPAVAPPAFPATEPAALTIDQRVAEKVHELFGGKIERFIDRKSKAAVEAFYAARNYMPLWIDNGAESGRAKAAALYLARVDADGLDPADYPLPSFSNADPAALAEAELKFTATVLTYARQAQVGRVHYSRVSSDIAYDLVPPEPATVLINVAEADKVGEALDSYNPPQPGFKALKAKLAELRGHRAGDNENTGRIALGPTLKVGMQDPRVPAVRERLGASGDGETYDKALADAVKKFQRQHDMSPTGTLTNAVVERFNGGGAVRHEPNADIIIANMERWRWLPRDLGKAYVMVNIPDYTLKVMDQGKMVWATKIVAGKPGEKATPLLSETMKYITVNPTWNVPPSIINNEYLPALAQDPTVLERMGLRVEHNRDGSLHIYQPPGERNALGRIRFNFPNKFLVYQHDTPDKNLFNVDKRAFSHGCMRVQYPDKYAEVLLNISNPRDGYTAERIHRMYGSEERDIHLNTPIPVHLTYQTAYVDDAGRLVIREDVYGRDARVLAALKNEDRRVAEIPVERAERREASNKPRRVVRMQAQQAQPQPPPAPAGFFGFMFR